MNHPIVKRLTQLSMLMLFCFTLASCKGDKGETEATRIVEAQEKPLTSPIFFNAFVEPLSIIKVTTPAEGKVEAIHFSYGEQVKNGQILLEVVSETLEKDYHDKLFKYLKAKQEQQTKKTEWENTQELDQYGLVAKNDFEAAKNQLADSTLARVQARQDLQNILETLDIAEFNFDKLDIHDTSEAVKQLSRKVNRLNIKSPRNGIALLPSRNGSDKEKITLGSPVSKNDVLVTVGDLSGITLNIKVNETQIELISPAQIVDISFIAHPSIQLTGEIAHIDTQAQSNNNENPTFPVQIKVTEIPTDALPYVLVGMSAKLKIYQPEQTAVMLPIDAVYQKEGKSYVDLIQPTTKEVTAVNVATGKTNLNEVAITRGIKAGDKVEVRRRVQKPF